MADTLRLSKIIAADGVPGLKSPCTVFPLKEYSTTELPLLIKEKLVCPLKLNNTWACCGKVAVTTVVLVKN